MIRFTLHNQLRFQLRGPLSPHQLFKRTIKTASKQSHQITTSAPIVDIFTPEQRALAAQERIDDMGPLVSRLPKAWIPYAELSRLDKLEAAGLIYLPCTWSILMAGTQIGAPLLATIPTLGLFGIGSVVMCGFGCTVNDLLDKDFDAKVLRTIERPLASGRVTKDQAALYALGQLSVGAAIALILPIECFIVGAAALLPVCLYPLFKRFTYYPQAWLGMTVNWGVLMAFPAMGLWNVSAMGALFASSYCWTLIYDTIYAHQDKKYDVNAGVKSTALRWGTNSKKVFSGLSVAQLSLLGYAGFSCGLLMNPGFLIGSGIFAYKLINMIRVVDLDNPKDCGSHFAGSYYYGLYLTGGLFFDYILMCFGLL